MLHYLALTWSAANETARIFASELSRKCLLLGPVWRRLLQGPTAVILASDDDHAISWSESASGQIVILGTLFPRTSSPVEEGLSKATVINDRDAGMILDTRGQALVSRWWGDYVAFLSDRDRGSLQVIRGPASTLACFHTRTEGVDVFFDSMSIAKSILTQRLRIAWPHLARSFMGPVCDGKTDVEEIHEVRPGQSDTVYRGARTVQVLWDPFDPSSCCPVDRSSAASLLRETIRMCVRTWANAHRSVLVALSGGLDSSVVASCLAPVRQRVVCLNQYAEDFASDERVFARAAAGRVGCRLIEHLRTADEDFASAVHQVPSANCPGLRLPEVDRVEPDYARKFSATAIFRGDGGDELFCRNQLALSLLDLVQDRGLGVDLVALATHAAAAEGVTGWHILARALRHRLRPRRVSFASALSAELDRYSLLTRECLESIRAESSEENSTAVTLAPGRSWQWNLLRASRTFTGPFSRENDAEYVAPLLSQPVIEACLSIPTYYQIASGQDRALTREAFAAELPLSILQRSEKGAAEILASRTVFRNLPFLRTMLLDGVLARQPFIDRHKLEMTLSDSPSTQAASSAPVFSLLGAEIWARAMGER